MEEWNDGWNNQKGKKFVAKGFGSGVLWSDK